MSLALASIVVGAACAGNLTTLCIFWSLADMALLIVVLLGSPTEGLAHGSRQMWTNLLATALLAGAAVLPTADDGLAAASTAPIGHALVVAAAVFRLGAYPLPGSGRTRWQAALVSLILGGALWVRLVNGLTANAALLAPSPAFVVLATWAALVVSSIAARERDLAFSTPFVSLHGIAVLALCAWMPASAARPVAAAGIVHLMLRMAALTVLRPSDRAQPGIGWRRWARVVTVGAAMGLPLSAGFVFQRAAVQGLLAAGFSGAAMVLWVSLALAQVPLWRLMWRLLRSAPRTSMHSQEHGPRRDIALSLASLGLILAGMLPGVVLAPLLGEAAGDLSLLGLHSTPSAGAGLSLLATITAPMLAAGIAFVTGDLSKRDSRVLDAIAALGELHWFYATVDLVIETVRPVLRTIMDGLHGPYAFAWCVGWVVLVALAAW